MYTQFFFPGQRIVAFPNRVSPRLILAGNGYMDFTLRRDLYPAFTFPGLVRREFLFFLAAIKLLPGNVITRNNSQLAEFTADVLNDAKPAAVIVGVTGAARKFALQLCDPSGEVIGYLKYAQTEIAQERLFREYNLLSSLPKGLAPQPLKFGKLDAGLGLLLSSVPGRRIKAELNWPGNLIEYTQRLLILKSPFVCVEDHPWIQSLIKTNSKAGRYVECLRDREWPVCFLHGDFTPWNILSTEKGCIQAVDWESGRLEGFIYIDLIYYFLRIAALVKKIPPETALYLVKKQLIKHFPQLNSEQANALVKLTAIDAIAQRNEEQYGPSDYLINWYLKLCGVN